MTSRALYFRNSCLKMSWIWQDIEETLHARPEETLVDSKDDTHEDLPIEGTPNYYDNEMSMYRNQLEKSDVTTLNASVQNQTVIIYQFYGSSDDVANNDLIGKVTEIQPLMQCALSMYGLDLEIEPVLTVATESFNVEQINSADQIINSTDDTENSLNVGKRNKKGTKKENITSTSSSSMQPIVTDNSQRIMKRALANIESVQTSNENTVLRKLFQPQPKSGLFLKPPFTYTMLSYYCFSKMNSEALHVREMYACLR